MGRLSHWHAEQRLIPREAAMDVRYADDCPFPSHGKFSCGMVRESTLDATRRIE
jgi:hypothetical protein